MGEPFVVDNSLVMSWCFEDEKRIYSGKVLDALGEHGALVPGIWPLEVASVLLVAQRKKRLGKVDAARFITLVRSLPIQVIQETPGRVMGEILALAHDTGLSSYDASYLDLAMREGLPLATLDKNMRKAAKRSHVSLVDP
ncbi:MAG: type II toxin-antitoxin system VapC family toxin [Deltaproteobacteria bacterium]|nr:type II toxin-antitoxin system VapC family toxin [Deltaproteobacteria bacterium]